MFIAPLHDIMMDLISLHDFLLAIGFHYYHGIWIVVFGSPALVKQITCRFMLTEYCAKQQLLLSFGSRARLRSSILHSLFFWQDDSGRISFLHINPNQTNWTFCL